MPRLLPSVFLKISWSSAASPMAPGGITAGRRAGGWSPSCDYSDHPVKCVGMIPGDICTTYVYIYIYICNYVCNYVCMYVCMYLSIDRSIYVCMYAWMYAWMYVCMYACMHVCMYTVCNYTIHWLIMEPQDICLEVSWCRQKKYWYGKLPGWIKPFEKKKKKQHQGMDRPSYWVNGSWPGHM